MTGHTGLRQSAHRKELQNKKGDRKMTSEKGTAKKSTQISLNRRSPTYWRVTFNNPPVNIFGPEGILQFKEIMTALESDEQVKVVVFDSAVEGFFLNHSDFLGRLEDLTDLPPGSTGLPA